MRVLFYGLGIFGISVLAHLIIWRVRPPRRGINTLLRIFFGSLIGALSGLAVLSFTCPCVNEFLPKSLPEYLEIALFVVSLAFSYVITYTAVEAQSPSIDMVMKIAAAGPGGLPSAEFDKLAADEVLVVPRVIDLLNDGMIYDEDGKYRLTGNGSMFVKVFILYRKFLKLPKGG